MPSRTRLRTAGMKGHNEFFAQVQAALIEIPGVRGVEVNPLTESILIEHEVPIERVASEAAERGYFYLDATPEEPYLERLERALSQSDKKLEEMTVGRVNFETVAFLGFVVGGIYQMATGRGLPAGVTLLRYAVELVTDSKRGGAAIEKNHSAG